jgi:hypothetical protein
MKTFEIMTMVGCIIFLLCFSIVFPDGDIHAAGDKYPIKVEIIDKSQARYDTPENTYAAMISSLIKKDLEWYYVTSTVKFAEWEQEQFQQANIAPTRMFDMINVLDEIFITNKVHYKDGVLLIIKTYKQDGATFIGPSALVKEQGKWKFTNKYADDEELHQYLDYIKPEEIISSAIKINPNRWNLNWYNWIKEHMEEKEWIEHFAEKVTILCMITNLKDNQGTPYSVKEIVPETILLNYLLPPQPWRFNSEEKVALIVKSKENRYLKERKGFKEWHHANKLLKKYKSPVILVKFNKFKAMETLPEMSPGKEYEATLSGELKNGKRFKGTTKIIITGWNAKHRWKWNHPDWLNSEKDIDNWWNKENDFEKRKT